MSQPVALFGLKVKPGDVHRIDVIRDFKVTNVSFAGDSLKGNSRAVVRVHITPSYGHPITEEDEEEEEEEDDDEEDEEAEPKQHEERSFVLCTLTPGKIEQASVDIAFSEEEEIGFSVSGDNEIDLLGNYVVPAGDFDQPPYDSEEDSDEDYEEGDDDDEYDSDEMDEDGLDGILAEGDSEDEDEEADSGRFQELGDVPSVAAAEKAAAAAGKKRKAVAQEPDVDADVSMASTSVGPVTDAELAAVAAAEGLDVSKLTKAQRKRLNKKVRTAEADADASVASAASASAKPAATKAKEAVKTTVVQDGKAKTAAKETTAKDGKQTSDKRKTASGLVIEVKKEGSGRVAKKGDKVGMRYIGKLTNGKIFDQNTKGKPFSFKLGRGEVIKGWDEGVTGMKVGEERRLTCPPQLAYGSRGAPPDIPKNATLVFDVRLVDAK